METVALEDLLVKSEVFELSIAVFHSFLKKILKKACLL